MNECGCQKRVWMNNDYTERWDKEGIDKMTVRGDLIDALPKPNLPIPFSTNLL